MSATHNIYWIISNKHVLSLHKGKDHADVKERYNDFHAESQSRADHIVAALECGKCKHAISPVLPDWMEFTYAPGARHCTCREAHKKSSPLKTQLHV